MERLSILDIAEQMLATAGKRPIAQMVALCEGAGILLDHARRNGAAEEAPRKKRRGRKLGRPKVRKARKARGTSRQKAAPKPVAPVPAPPAQPPAAPVVPAKPESPPGGAPFHARGVTLHFDPGHQRICFKDKETELTARQAQLAAALMRGAPNPIGRNHLIEKLGIGGSFADTQLGTWVGDLRRAVATIGLDVKTFKGIGVALAIPEASGE